MSEHDQTARETGAAFLPKFDSQGLLTAVAVDAATRDVLMVAFMDAEAVEKTRETGIGPLPLPVARTAVDEPARLRATC